MAPPGTPIHIVADFGTGGDLCAQAIALHRFLGAHTQVTGWSSASSSIAAASGLRVRTLNAFGGDFPVGGKLIIVGPRQSLSPWVEHCKAQSIVIYSDSGDAEALFRLLASLRNAELPEAELAFASNHLRDFHGLGGMTIPPLLDVENFSRAPDNPRPILGMPAPRSEIDAAAWSLCRSWALAGLDVRLLALSPSAATPAEVPAGITLCSRQADRPQDCYRELDIFFLPATPEVVMTPPRVLLEAMAAGCAIVASGEWLADWITDGDSGYLVNSADAAWAKVRELTVNPELRHRLGRAASQRAGELSGLAARAEIIRCLWDTTF